MNRRLTRSEMALVQAVNEYYAAHARTNLPWRNNYNPYTILVSEVMLQQTQVDRVIPKYQAFLKVFPTVTALAEASLGDVLALWQGLGYNRRAKYLHQAAKAVRDEHGGAFPYHVERLKLLPGVGSYTAGAIMAFAYNIPEVFIETNIRTVFLYHLYPKKSGVTDAEIRVHIARTLDHQNPRDWYYALMDYGSYLKQVHRVRNHQSKHYTKQAVFKGSQRQLRGRILKLVTQERSVTEQNICSRIADFEVVLTRAQVKKLITEGLLQKEHGRICLPH